MTTTTRTRVCATLFAALAVSSYTSVASAQNAPVDPSTPATGADVANTPTSTTTTTSTQEDLSSPSSAAPTTVVASTNTTVEDAPSGGKQYDALGRNKNGRGLSFGLQGGVTYFTEGTPFGTAKGIGRALTPGPNLGVRGSFELLPWLALDGRFIYSNDQGNNIVGSGALSTVGGFGAVRFTLPIWRVKPYAFAGFGVHREIATGTSTQLVSGTFSAFEAGIGVLLPIDKHFDVGAEYGYAHLNGEVLSTNDTADGGDPTNLSIFAQYRFDL